jgi:hypothetical protein
LLTQRGQRHRFLSPGFIVTMTPASTPTVFWRGLTLRCPVCASSRLFRRYFLMRPTCPRCGLHFERLDGHWTGALGLNIIATFVLLFMVLLGGTLLSLDDPDVTALGLAAALVAVGFPIAFLPFSQTLWLAIDIRIRPLEAGEVAPEYRRGDER